MTCAYCMKDFTSNEEIINLIMAKGNYHCEGHKEALEPSVKVAEKIIKALGLKEQKEQDELD